MRKTIFLIFGLVISINAFGGDIANFENLGFSNDGLTFAFGQFGVQDGSYRSYAEIYFVDVKENIFIKNGVFKLGPSVSTQSKDPRGLFQTLKNNSKKTIEKHNVVNTKQGRIIYFQVEEDNQQKELSFRDFETSNEYNVKINILNESSNKNISSSFYLTVSQKDKDENINSYTVGLPGFKRKDVKDYIIQSIICDDSGKSLVFIIEKVVSDVNGDSIRYMVETLRVE